MATAPQKRKCVVLTIEEKLMICKHARLGDSNTAIADKYKIRKTTVYDIVKSEKLKRFQSEIEQGACVKKR